MPNMGHFHVRNPNQAFSTKTGFSFEGWKYQTSQDFCRFDDSILENAKIYFLPPSKMNLVLDQRSSTVDAVHWTVHLEIGCFVIGHFQSHIGLLWPEIGRFYRSEMINITSIFKINLSESVQYYWFTRNQTFQPVAILGHKYEVNGNWLYSTYSHYLIHTVKIEGQLIRSYLMHLLLNQSALIIHRNFV